MDNIKDNYPVNILLMKLWEWEAIKENASVQIARHGPEQYMCESHNEAVEKIESLKTAINHLQSLTQHT